MRWQVLDAHLVGGPHDGGRLALLVQPGEPDPARVAVRSDDAGALTGRVVGAAEVPAAGEAAYLRTGASEWRHEPTGARGA